ncbi:hypothetical protein MHYP_G00063750 [Metynnis hypsauchen]
MLYPLHACELSPATLNHISVPPAPTAELSPPLGLIVCGKPTCRNETWAEEKLSFSASVIVLSVVPGAGLDFQYSVGVLTISQHGAGAPHLACCVKMCGTRTRLLSFLAS